MDPNKRRQILCCAARSWALCIGYIQVVFSIIFIVMFLILTVVFSIEDKASIEGQEQTTESPESTVDGVYLLQQIRDFAGIFIGIVAAVIGLFAGILLIVGVKKRKARKLKIWISLEFVTIVFSLVGVFVGLFLGGEAVEVAVDVVAIVLGFFFIFIVNIHRHELLNRHSCYVEHPPFLN